MIGRCVAAILIAASLFGSTARAADLKAILADAADGRDAPGAGLLTIRNDAIADEAVYGVRRLGDPAAVTTKDVWNIGSDSKTAAKLLADGK